VWARHRYLERSHFVVVPPDRDDEPVREFPGFTVSRMRPGDRATATSLQAHAGEPAKGKGY